MTDNALVRLSAAAQALVEAKDLNEVKQIRDLAQAAGVYARAAKLGLDAQNTAAEIKLRAERKAGEMLAQLEREPGKYGISVNSSNVGRVHSEYQLVLSDTGTSRQEANRWQTEATMPEEVFEAHIAEAKAERKELTTAGVLEEVRSLTQAENRKGRVDSIIAKNKPLDTGKRYSVIYADPPWQYSNSGFNESAESQYATMPTEDICKMSEQVEKWATPETVLFLWATNPMLPDALKVMSAWGFEYKTNMAWIKDKGRGKGWFLKSKHELLLIAVKKNTPHPQERPDSCFEAERGTVHSKKPEMVYEIIESMYPGNKIELFARNSRIGWESWGNEL